MEALLDPVVASEKQFVHAFAGKTDSCMLSVSFRAVMVAIAEGSILPL
jgi:hypothetical protein